MKKYFGKILLVVVPVIAAIVLLYPTYQASKLEEKEAQAIAKAKQATNSTDSLAIMEAFKKQYGEALKTAKARRLKLGLDLRGGMYVTMEVDVVKLIEETAQRETIDEIFKDVIAKTRKEAANTDEAALNIFLRNFDKIARPQGKSLLNYFDVGDLRDASEEKIISSLNESIDKAIDQAQEVIRQRIDQYGVSEPNIQKQGSRRIMLELPGITNQDEMRSLLQTTARLEFKLVRNYKEIVQAFYKIDQMLSNKIKSGKGLIEKPIAQLGALNSDTIKTEQTNPKQDTTKIAQKTDTTSADTTKSTSDSVKDPYAGLPPEEAQRRYALDHPFTTLFSTFFVPGQNQNIVPIYYTSEKFPDGEYIFRIPKDSISKLLVLLSRPDVAALIPVDLEIAVDAKPDTRLKQRQNIEIFDFYALKKEPELTGEVISNARASFDPTTNQPVVLMSMSSEGAESWARITGANLKKRIAIVLDGRVYSAPTVQSKITGGNSQITGMANTEEARLLEIVLNAGALKAPVQIIEERIVGPSLGEDSIRSGLNASLIAVILVILYMFMYYGVGGALADFAVLLNVALILSALTALGGTLTLPGIAGIILTVGMAIDANVLIFERIREELDNGRSMRSAIDEGFRKALSAIMDSNITTFFTGAILYFLGTGPIQGFALTLMIGILGTLFTAVTVTRAIIEIIMAQGVSSIDFGQPKIKQNN
ncbi:MAG: protein translocase subunit SecD [Bacteroidota bacterium]